MEATTNDKRTISPVYVSIGSTIYTVFGQGKKTPSIFGGTGFSIRFGQQAMEGFQSSPKAFQEEGRVDTTTSN